MVRDRIRGIAVRAAVDACEAGVTAVVAAPRLRDAIRGAALGAPARYAHGRSRARGDARAFVAPGARVEAGGRTCRARRHVEEERAAERDPRPELRMQEHADKAPSAESRGLRQVDERERRLENAEGQA